MKYTWTETPHVSARLWPPGSRLGVSTLGNFAFVLGDPEVGALIVEGTKVQLAEFADSLHVILMRDPHKELALAVAERVFSAAKGGSTPAVDCSHDLAHRLARDVSLAVVAELKTAGYLTPPTPGVT